MFGSGSNERRLTETQLAQHVANASLGLKECLTHLNHAIVYNYGILQGCLLYPKL